LDREEKGERGGEKNEKVYRMWGRAEKNSEADTKLGNQMKYSGEKAGATRQN